MYRDGRLLRSYREGPGPEGFADDYVAMSGAALDLYEATAEIAWLQWALELQRKLDALFLDAENGGYFSARAGDDSILVRMKEDHDGAEPAASSMAARNCLRLARMLDDPALEARARETMQSFAAQLRAMPTSMPAILSALLYSMRSHDRSLLPVPPPMPNRSRARRGGFASRTPSSCTLMADPVRHGSPSVFSSSAPPLQSMANRQLTFAKTLLAASGHRPGRVAEPVVIGRIGRLLPRNGHGFS